MSATKEMICIRCPIGCRMVAAMDNGAVAVRGNACKRGVEYAEQEMRCPMRVVTSSVRVPGGVRPVCSVKTAEAIPKSSIERALREIARLSCPAPIRIGQVLLENIADSGVPLVATSANEASQAPTP